MDSYYSFFLVLAGLSWILHAIYVYLPWGIQDIPNERSLHTTPTRKSGGVVFIPLFLISFFYFKNQGIVSPPISWIFWGVLFFATLGLLDDLLSLPALFRLGLEFAFIFCLFYTAFPSWNFLFLPFGISFSSFVIPCFLLTFFIVFGINLVNFMDGMDSYVTLTLFSALLYFGFLFSPKFFYPEPLFLVLLLFVLSLSGFLFFNLPKARLFMGDVGSLSIGFFWLTLPLLDASSVDRKLALWDLFFVFPVFWLDGLSTLIHRLLQGKNVLKAHREHLYQLLTETKIGKLGSLVLCLLGNLPFWILYFGSSKSFSLFLSLAGIGFVLFFSLRLGLFHARKNLAE